MLISKPVYAQGLNRPNLAARAEKSLNWCHCANDKVVLYVLQKQSQNIKKCFQHKKRFLDVSVKYKSTSKLALLLFATVLPKPSPLWLCCATHRASLQGHCRRPLHGPLAVVVVVKKAPPPACSDRLNDIMMGHRQLCTAIRHCHRFSRRLIG